MGKNTKNQILKEIAIESASSDGKCVARWNNQVVFVEGLAPGDIADLRVIRKKRRHLEAVPERLIHPSEIRVVPFCQHFGVCGGCKWQHIAYENQLELKRQLVIDNLERIGGLSLPEVQETLPSPQTQYHRNKLEFTFSNRRWLDHEEILSGDILNRDGLGFHKPRQYDKIVDIDQCYLQKDPSNEIRNAIRSYAREHDLSFYDIRRKQGFLRNLIIRSTDGDQLMVIVQVGQDHPELQNLMDFIRGSYPDITSLQYVINNKGNETFFDLPVQLHSGQEYITESMGSLKFRIGAKSFYQTNNPQAHRMYDLIRKLARLSGKETVFDLYTGAGTIALYLADSAKQVVGVEQVPEAIEDAKENSRLNGIANCHFYTGDTKDLLEQEIINKHGKPQVIITDPPRSGMHVKVTAKIIELGPQQIVYVSCNPATQARDLALLDHHYQIKSVHPVDMFPHTAHVECVVLLELRK